VTFRMSTYSNGTGQCVEVDEAGFRKATHSKSGNCVEVGSGVKVRDTKYRDDVTLTFEDDAWRLFIAIVKVASRE
jgi:hypothetical protein